MDNSSASIVCNPASSGASWLLRAVLLLVALGLPLVCAVADPYPLFRHGGISQQ